MTGLKTLWNTLSLSALMTSSLFAADWSIVELGLAPSPFDLSSGGNSINEAGQVVGAATGVRGVRPVDFGSGSPQLIDVSRTYGAATDINNSGVIVGYTGHDSGAKRAFVVENGFVTELGTLGGSDSVAFAINDSGTIVGRSTTATGLTHAFVYSNGTMTDIGSTGALGINAHGDVVGYDGLPGGGEEGFVWRDGIRETIAGGLATAINDRGLIAGTMSGNTFEDIKAAYYEDGGWHSLGTLGGVTSNATGVNNRDQIVGYSDVEPGEAAGLQHGFLYSNGVMTNVNSLIDPALGWTDLFAYAINDRGQITGSGILNGQWQAFVLTPEMSTFALDMSYGDPSLVAGVEPLSVSADDSNLPGDVSVKFLLEGIADNPGAFRLEDVASALISLDGLTWMEADLTSFRMTLGPGGVDDILSLSYAFAPFFTSDGLELTLLDNQFQLQIGVVDPLTQESFDYIYGDSMQSLAVVPEPGGLVLAAVALLAVLAIRRTRCGL